MCITISMVPTSNAERLLVLASYVVYALNYNFFSEKLNDFGNNIISTGEDRFNSIKVEHERKRTNDSSIMTGVSSCNARESF